ncbi:MAG: hypothetical protein IJK74_00830 [Bacteroidales bacterium]|nr:hypothetical protein [Bacteroidales bacterium]
MFCRKDFIQAFSELGKRLGDLSVMESSMESAQVVNPLFTPYMQKRALKAIAEEYLTRGALEKLLAYSDGPSSDPDLFRRMMSGKVVGIIMAGNIPAVGFHDLLCTLSTGARAVVKLSSKDDCLIPSMVDIAAGCSPDIASRVLFRDFISDRIEGIKDTPKLDFLIFSGSNRTKALVCDEFKELPVLARGSRFSLGVLSGRESDSDLEKLAEDVFLYCGLGCRSISYLFLPEGFDIWRIIKASQRMKPYLEVITPYMNSYIRERAVAVLSGGRGYADGGFFLLEESIKPFPQMGVVRYSFYKDLSEVEKFCDRHRDAIQKKYVKFGMAQSPAVDEWMDGINTVDAILEGCGILSLSKQ